MAAGRKPTSQDSTPLWVTAASVLARTLRGGSLKSLLALFDPLNGTLRLGTDALPWECVIGDMGAPMWVPSSQIIKPKKGEEVNIGKPKAGAQLVGALIDVHWPLDEAWYPARVLKFDEKTLKHKIKYIEDQVVEHVNLSGETWRLAPKLEDEPGPFADGGVAKGGGAARVDRHPVARKKRRTDDHWQRTGRVAIDCRCCGKLGQVKRG